MNIAAEFVLSAAAARQLPRDGTPEIAFVGRSNVGKSSLINALVRRSVARTSAAPGKTRLVNVYRVRRGAAVPLYLIDLPGYGYTRGSADAASGFDRLAREYFGRDRSTVPAWGVLLVVDSRHAGLASDLNAWAWLGDCGLPRALVAAKVDKLGRTARTRAHQEIERAFNEPALAVSATTGEGLEELWRQIVKLVSMPRRGRHSPSSSSRRSKT